MFYSHKFCSASFITTTACRKMGSICRADSRFVPNQWKTLLQSNAVPHWLGANLESALHMHITTTFMEGVTFGLSEWTIIEIFLNEITIHMIYYWNFPQWNHNTYYGFFVRWSLMPGSECLCTEDHLDSKDHEIDVDLISIWHFRIGSISNRHWSKGFCYLGVI